MRRDRLYRPARTTSGQGIKRVGYACAGVVALGAGYWLLHGKGSDAIPVVTADASPIRVRPADPGGMNVNQIGNLVFDGSDDDTQTHLSAPAEMPDTAALHASEKLHVKTSKPSADHLPGSDTDG
ncbi:MAG TPA: hypothetical protein VHB27_03950 [Rhodopila sp.]|uniref:hypothetical protein n=1 Tax=Rhodopila sp. TaxID=2480087 RepID=UPI002BE33AFA|nr:hypothetical protein [Rhodopila sp.]HVY14356.1 hypothetical protein [Rhodopila sp.]